MLRRRAFDAKAKQKGVTTEELVNKDVADKVSDPSEEEIRTAISGAICRCTGYANIVRAIRWAAEKEGAKARS